jgi:signal transduction histidine kinase
LSHQPVGCINIEHLAPHRFNASTISVLMSMRDALSVAVGREVDIDLLSTIHETSEIILRDAKALLTSHVLDSFAEKVRRHAMTDEVIFCARRRAAKGQVQAAYDVVAASDQVRVRSRNIIRHSGWTSYLWDQPPENVAGIVLSTRDERGLSRVANAWQIRVNQAEGGNDDVSLVPIADRISDRVEVNPAGAAAGVRMQVGVRVRQAQSSMTTTVIWFSFIYPGRAYPTMGLGTQGPLLGCVRNLLSVARWCSMVPDMVRSRALMYGRFYNAMSHEGLGAIVDSASHDLGEASTLLLDAHTAITAAGGASKALAKNLTDCRDRVDTAELAVEYLLAKIDALTHYSAFEDDDQLAKLVEKRVGVIDFFQILEQAWHLSTKTYHRRPKHKAQLKVGGDEVRPMFVRTSRRHLLVLLVNVLQNCMKHGRAARSVPPAESAPSVVHVRASMLGDKIRVVNSDNGKGFPKEFLDRDMQEVLDRGVPGTVERQGAMLIKRLSRAIALGESAVFRNGSSGGAEVEFAVPAGQP